MVSILTMKKKILPHTTKIFKSIFNVPAWFDWTRLKAFTLYLQSGIKKFFVPQPKEASESFEQAQERLGLTDALLVSRQNALWRLSILMIAIAAGFLLYSFYQLFEGHISAFILSIIVMCISLVLAFRYHFWYFQIKKRKLGCTFAEWYQCLKGDSK
jgi:intracellular multiplication protein IcmV